MQALTYLKSHRLWVVPNVLVWGLADEADFQYFGLENVDTAGRLMFGNTSLGGSAQTISFSDLIDFRGNHLPSNISSPRIIIRPRSPYVAHLIGEEYSTGFRLARDIAAPGPISVDIFIYEMGQ
jgi:hypothetical protein